MHLRKLKMYCRGLSWRWLKGEVVDYENIMSALPPISRHNQVVANTTANSQKQTFARLADSPILSHRKPVGRSHLMHQGQILG